jgi:hypothetical protein
MTIDRATRSRAPTLADAAEIAAFIQACAAADGTTGPDSDEIQEWLTDARFDVENNFRVWTVAGELVAYSDLGVFDDCVWLELDAVPIYGAATSRTSSFSGTFSAPTPSHQAAS